MAKNKYKKIASAVAKSWFRSKVSKKRRPQLIEELNEIKKELGVDRTLRNFVKKLTNDSALEAFRGIKKYYDLRDISIPERSTASRGRNEVLEDIIQESSLYEEDILDELGLSVSVDDLREVVDSIKSDYNIKREI